ncbi:translation initiation factor IF-2 [Nocardiopsis sp. HNM0947]|uniref:Translation initiation factor IF-2 n=1 Tax=Nocardiopsis coralli TaxID=2772213 RepID=A0ABR9PEC5_9ACTN|nr:translation initiation factor IF-2 [Nocardiopsis coralli]MBE3002176.1 translation initiation factor IF-2 [Nocardiopsis coralli]
MQSPSDPWATVEPDRHVLAVVRSVPVAGRLLDVAGLLADDRVGLTYTVTPGSVSESGVVPALRAAGVERILPWEEAVERSSGFDLALAASTKGGLHRLETRLVLMPHGAGHNRRVGSAPGSLTHASGLDAAELLHGGEPIASRFLFSHSEQSARLDAALPSARGRGVVVGDPAHDRMLAALGRRDRYRDALDLRGRRLVVVSSTWNRGSLLGSRRALIRELLARLPHDEYRVALVAHPNVHRHHDPSQLELWFVDEVEAGLALIPDAEGWRAALIAADVVVGDQGSVTYYAAALRRPVLLAAFETGDLDPDSPLLEFGGRLPRIDGGEDLAAQVDRAARTPPAPVADLLIEHPGGSAARVRSVLYDLLDLPEDRLGPARYRSLPDLPDRPEDVTAWRVDARTDGDARVVDLRRRPASAPGSAGPERAAVLPLVVDAEDTAMPHWAAADAWSHRRPRPGRGAAAWSADRLEAYPKAVVAAAAASGPGGNGVLVLHRSGGAMLVRTPLDEDSGWYSAPEAGGPDASLVASAAVAWARAGLPWRAWHDRVRLVVGEREVLVEATPPPPDFGFSQALV